jgi:hypothetical protein
MTPDEIIEEAGRAFDAWREEFDPMHELPIEQAAEAYCRHAMNF